MLDPPPNLSYCKMYMKAYFKANFMFDYILNMHESRMCILCVHVLYNSQILYHIHFSYSDITYRCLQGKQHEGKNCHSVYEHLNSNI